MNNVVEELKKVSVFYVATIEENQPRVRPFSSVTEFEGNAYICCGNHKAVYRQLTENPRVELCGMYEGGAWLRVTATVKEDDRVEVQQAMLEDPTGPKGLYKAGDGNFVTYRLTDVSATKYSFFAPPEEVKEHD